MTAQGFEAVAGRYGSLARGKVLSEEAPIAPGVRYLTGRRDPQRIVDNANADVEAWARNAAANPNAIMRFHIRDRVDGAVEQYAATSEKYLPLTGGAEILEALARSFSGSPARGLIEYAPDSTWLKAKIGIAPDARLAPQGKVGYVYKLLMTIALNDAGKGGGSVSLAALCARCVNLTTIEQSILAYHWRHLVGSVEAAEASAHIERCASRFDAAGDQLLRGWNGLAATQVSDVAISRKKVKVTAEDGKTRTTARLVLGGATYDSPQSAIVGISDAFKLGTAAKKSALASLSTGAEEDDGTWNTVYQALTRAPQVPDARPDWQDEIERAAGELLYLFAKPRETEALRTF